MAAHRNDFILGLVVLTAAALFVGGVIYVGSGTFGDRVPIVVRMQHEGKLPRLKSGAPIICGPVQIGTVVSVHMIEDVAPDDLNIKDYLYFEVRGMVDPSIGLRKDCKIVVEGQLLGDDGLLRVVSRGLDPAPLEPGTPVLAHTSDFSASIAMITDEFDNDDPTSLISQIKGQLDPSGQTLMGKIHHSLSDFNEMTASLKNSLDPTREAAIISKIGAILDHINTISRTLNGQLDPTDDGMILAKIHQGLDHLDVSLETLAALLVENREGIHDTVQNVASVSGQIEKDVIPTLVAELNRGDAESLLSQVHRSFELLEHSLVDVRSITEKADRVATMGEGHVQSILKNADEASVHIKLLLKNLRENPWRLIHEPGEKESRQSYIFDAARSFAEASADLDASIKAIEALLEANSGAIPDDDPALEDVREQIRASLKKFSEAERALWNQLDVP